MIQNTDGENDVIPGVFDVPFFFLIFHPGLTFTVHISCFPI